ncbi:MAG: type VI secretion system tip protein TssI/VgrG [Polyangiaceae bacterium]
MPTAGHTLRIDGRAGALDVVSYRATEALSELSRVDAKVVVDPGEALEPLLGARAELVIDGAPPRAIALVITRIGPSTERTRDGRAVARARLAPALWLLSRGSDTRVFQDRPVPNIIEAVLAERRITARFELARQHPSRAYAVQYEESDYAFLARLAAEEGLYFYFDDAPSGAVVFADATAAYARLPTRDDGPLHYLEQGGLQHGGETVGAFATDRSIRPGRVVRSDYDPLRPAFAVRARADARDAAPVEAALEVYDPRTEYDAPSLDRQSAEGRVAAERSRAAVSRGESACRGVAPGRRFTLDGHPDARENGEHVVVRARHEGFSPRLVAEGTAERRTFACTFESVRAGVLYRPPPKRRPPTQVIESAVVVGPEGEDIHTDELGRVKVQFHWDRKGTGDDRSSCWLRVLTPWAGSGWGVQCIPRVGMEVIVSFLGGDPDRPVVLGALANETHPPPFVLPKERTRTGLRTRSSPPAPTGGSDGYNELSFDDARGRERVVVRAERDLVESAENDHSIKVGGHQRTIVLGEASLDVATDRSERVRGRSTLEVGGERAISVAADSRTIVGGGAVTTIAGPLAERIGAGVQRAVGGGSVTTIGGDREERVDGSASTEIARDAGLHVGGHASITVGGEEDADGGDASVDAERDVAVTSGGSVKVTAAKAITLEVAGASLSIDADVVRIRVGDTSITLNAEAIALAARALKLTATDTIEIARDESVIVLDDAVRIAADDVALHAHAATLELGGDASLRGDRVRLGSGHGQGPEVNPDEPPAKDPKETELRMVLRDRDGAPLANKAYTLTVDGKALPSKRTAGDGSIVETVPAGAVAGMIVVTVDESHTLRIPLAFQRLPSIDTVAGVKARLRNLGYFRGPVDDALDRETREAVRRFQERQRIEASGSIDSATRARVRELAGA